MTSKEKKGHLHLAALEMFGSKFHPKFSRHGEVQRVCLKGKGWDFFLLFIKSLFLCSLFGFSKLAVGFYKNSWKLWLVEGTFVRWGLVMEFSTSGNKG